MLALALILDALIGEPGWLWRRVPHPAVLVGRLVDHLDQRLNQGTDLRAKGAFAVAVLCVATAVPASILSLEAFRGIFEILIVAILLAHRSLITHVRAVAAGLRVSLEQGRSAVSQIVGRDPQSLDEAGVARAAIESVAENFSDGVVAPVFWYLVAGLPGIAIYKAVNTADSMIGHRNERYEEFGWAAARLDDVLNWVPARLTGFLFCLVGEGKEAMNVMLRDAPKHKSPNAGWPEAAMAASLDVALAGPRTYGGTVTEDPYLNVEASPDAGPEHIDRALMLTWFAWVAILAIALLAAFVGR